MITLQQAAQLCIKSKLNVDELSQLMQVSIHLCIEKDNNGGQLSDETQQLLEQIEHVLNINAPKNV